MQVSRQPDRSLDRMLRTHDGLVRPLVNMSLLFHHIEKSITPVRQPSRSVVPSPSTRECSVLQPEQNRHRFRTTFCCCISFLSLLQDFCSEIRTRRPALPWHPILPAAGLVDRRTPEKRFPRATRDIGYGTFAGKPPIFYATLPFCRFTACKRRPFTVKR